MPASGNAFITILDGASGVQVPASSVQLVIGCSSGGTAYQIVATSNPQTLTSTCGYGIGVEAAALTCVAGGTVLFVKVPTHTTGTASAVTTGAGNTSTSVLTKTLDGTTGAFDDYDVKVKVILGGTIGASATIQVSLDAGRNYGSNVVLGTANTYVISNTGITLNFGAGTLVTGDTFTFGTTGPGWQDTDVQTALNTVAGSQYGVVGWGSTHIVGNGGGYLARMGGVPGADVATIEGYLDTIATGFDFTRAFVSASDAGPPAAYGGSGETEATWETRISADFAATSAKRVCVGAGNWNMPSAYPNASAGAPRFRRNVAWAAAARKVTVPPQRHLGKVADGSLAQIVVDPVNDPLDGFIYHDESQNGGLDYKYTGTGARFMTTTTRKGRPGVFITNNLLMAPLGSDFWLESLGSIMDIACSIVHQVGEQFINEDIRLNANGTISEKDATYLETVFTRAIQSQMLSAAQLSPPGATVVVNRTNNVQSSGQVLVAITIYSLGYILSEQISIGFNNPLAAA